MSEPKALICPYCGETQPLTDRCRSCGGLLDQLSRQATHNQMGPWFVRNPERPFQPGCSYETLVRLIDRGQVTRVTLVRGPTTGQFWSPAKRVRGIAHLLGSCHSCGTAVESGDHGCPVCGAPFGAFLDRNHLGLPEVQPLPGDPGAPGNADVRESKSTEAPTTPAAFQPAAPRPTGGSISSFATDDELRAADNPLSGGAPSTSTSDSAPLTSVTMASAPVGAPPSYGPLPSLAPTPQGPSAAEAWAGSPAARSLQRRVMHQQRTIRMLAIGLFAVLCIAIIVILVSMLSGSGRGDGPGAATGRPIPAPVVPSNASTSTSTADDQPIDFNAMSGPDAETPLDEPDSSADTVESRFATELASAVAVVARADDTMRPIPERLADYRAALRDFEAIAAQVTPQAQPAGLADRIQHVRDAIERLEVEAYFVDPESNEE